MTAVLVHGVPDTAHVWHRLVPHLGRVDVVTVALPGFGTPRPLGFAATKEAYAEWLAAEIAAIGAPVDLVGHDWGSLLVQRVASQHPDLVRTWSVGGAFVDPTYEWHDVAQLWQTPEVGEQVMAALRGPVLAEALTGAGVPALEAAAASERVDDEMATCILALYRSAVDVGAQWDADLDQLPAAGLVLHGVRDGYVPPVYAERFGSRTGAPVHLLDSGHWWELERPDEVAELLRAHWSPA